MFVSATVEGHAHHRGMGKSVPAAEDVVVELLAKEVWKRATRTAATAVLREIIVAVDEEVVAQSVRFTS